MKFKNADKNDQTIYYVNGNNQITGPDHSPIRFQDSVLTLYSLQDKQPTFTGKRTIYNAQYNFVSNPYSTLSAEKCQMGKHLAVVSK